MSSTTAPSASSTAPSGDHDISSGDPDISDAVVFDNSSIRDVLTRIDFLPKAIEAFLECQTYEGNNMLQFIRTLRKLSSPLFDKQFSLLQLEAHSDWDNNWDTGDFTILAHWFFHNDTYKDSFDWDTNLQYEEYRVFRARYDRCEIPNDSPGISTEDETLPTAHTAGITADTVLPPVYETTTPASIPTPTASVATTDDVSYLHDYHDAILAADSADY